MKVPKRKKKLTPEQLAKLSADIVIEHKYVPDEPKPKEHKHKWGEKSGGFFAGYTRSCTVKHCRAILDIL